jgi:tetratricopeptide (TPR) repeat protein
MSFQPRIFTFYSYKGGVGRSMALLNMAYYLQARGRHVLIVDLDLEAPGASGFLHRSKELMPCEGTGDVVDVLKKVVDAVKQAPAGTEPQLPALHLKDYLRSVDPKKYATAVHPKAPRARLDVLGAEQGPNYTAKFSALELPSLSTDQIGDASDLLRGLLIRHSFPFSQPWQEEGAAPESTHYDYILVDSRTGLSEIGGLCVGPLSDRLIVLCGLNDQNIEGTRDFMDVVGLQPRSRAANAEAFDDADLPSEDGQRPATLGPKPTLLVASPVPGGEMTYKNQRMDELERRLGMIPAKLSYHPHMALMETLFVRDHADEYLALEYATLAGRMMSMVGDTAQQLMEPVHRLVASRFNEDEKSTTSAGRGTVDHLVGPMLRLLSLRSSKKDGKLDTADLLKRLARRALSGGQNDAGLPSFMIRSLDLPGEDQAKIWQLLINMAPTDEEAAQRWLGWADAMNTEGARETGDHEAFSSIEEKYRKAVTLSPRFHQALQHWGVTLAKWANTKDTAGAHPLFAQACEKFQQAEVVRPNEHETLHNWGVALAQWANIKKGVEADALLAQACEKFEQASATESDDLLLSNWGGALTQRAVVNEGAEADALFAQACEKYQQLIAAQPNDCETLYSWGTTLAQWARTTEGEKADTLLGQASERFEKLLLIQPDDGSALYNLGCIAALRGKLEEAVAALEKWKSSDPEANKAKLDEDTDFDLIRNDPRFLAFREGLAG